MHSCELCPRSGYMRIRLPQVTRYACKEHAGQVIWDMSMRDRRFEVVVHYPGWEVSPVAPGPRRPLS